jgi:hypothetical protein
MAMAVVSSALSAMTLEACGTDKVAVEGSKTLRPRSLSEVGQEIASLTWRDGGQRTTP